MRRLLAALPLVLALAACGASTRDLQEPTEPLGDFKVGHIGVVAPNLQKLLVSRDATEEEWIAAVTDALDTRFRRFGGDKFYHIGVSIEAYSLPPPIVPGKSALALNVTIWDDAAQAKLNTEPKQIHVIKVFESRISKNREQQLQGLAEEAALLVEVWLREMQESDAWFGGMPREQANATPVGTGSDNTPGATPPRGTIASENPSDNLPPNVLGQSRAAGAGAPTAAAR